jgi:HK97 family phage portal protein
MGKIWNFSSINSSFSQKPFWSWVDSLTGRASKAGVNISNQNSLTLSAYYSGVTLISQVLAYVPLIVYKRLERGKERAINHSLYSVLHDQPNPFMTAYDFKETLQGHVLTWGNAYAEIEWEDLYNVRWLWPLRPDRMTVKYDNGEVLYDYQLPDGNPFTLPSRNVLHIPGFGFNGLIGYDPMTLMREALGLTKALEENGARFFANGSQLSGVLSHPKVLSDESTKRMRSSWEDIYRGLSNSHRVAILEEGVTFQEIGVRPENAQFLETRKFQIAEVARFLHIPPHLLADLEHATFSNIEHLGIEFNKITMMPWFTRWQQRVNNKLISLAERKEYFTEFLQLALLQGDADSRGKFYNQLFMIGSITPNEIRERENLNPMDGGDTAYVPLNMIQMDKADQILQGDSKVLLLKAKNNNAILRARTAKSFEPVFKSMAERIVKEETKAVSRAAKKYLKTKSAADFQQWLKEYYKDFEKYINRQALPVFQTLLESIVPLSKNEVGFDGDIDSEMKRFIDGYVKAFNYRYTSSSEGQLKDLLEGDEDPLPIIEERLTEWEEKRPGKLSLEETVHLSNEIGKAVWLNAGVTKLMWVALGSKSCPLCQELNGKIVGIDQPFLDANSVLEAEGVSDLKCYHPTFTPPLHGGCVCSIQPV